MRSFWLVFEEDNLVIFFSFVWCVCFFWCVGFAFCLGLCSVLVRFSVLVIQRGLCLL